MNWRKLIKSILYPHTAVMVVLLPIATMFLVFSMVYIGTESIASRRIMLGTTGTAVSAFVIAMAVVMIVQSTKRIKEMKLQEEKSNGEQG